MSRFNLAHLSDLHFGKIAHAGIVEALVEEVNGLDLDLVVVSGDLTQRARVNEFQDASAMIGAIEAPTLVVPGNHDVYSWLRPFRRVFSPLSRYQRLIDPNLTPSFEANGVAVLGLNSAHGLTIKGGRLDKSTGEAVTAYFSEKAPSVFKVIVLHHHMSRIQALRPHDVARKGRNTLERAGDVGVDLILCGHIHISHVERLEVASDRRRSHRIVVAVAGTTTSSRGRRQHRATNFYNVIHVKPRIFTVEERRYAAEEGRFISEGSMRFERADIGSISPTPHDRSS